MAAWERELRALVEGGEATERAMLLRWFRRRPGLLDRSGEGELEWVGLYELDAAVGAPATIVFPIRSELGPGVLDQESFVLVRGTTEPGRAVVVITSLGELVPAGRPRRPLRSDPSLVGEL